MIVPWACFTEGTFVGTGTRSRMAMKRQNPCPLTLMSDGSLMALGEVIGPVVSMTVGNVFVLRTVCSLSAT